MGEAPVEIAALPDHTTGHLSIAGKFVALSRSVVGAPPPGVSTDVVVYDISAKAEATSNCCERPARLSAV